MSTKNQTKLLQQHSVSHSCVFCNTDETKTLMLADQLINENKLTANLYFIEICDSCLLTKQKENCIRFICNRSESNCG
jgi:hypothetical protein